MAYGDSGTKFWQADLTTRTGAQTAAHQGALACFIACGLTLLSVLFLGSQLGFTTLAGIVASMSIGINAIIYGVAGLRFRAGKGAFWGIAAAIFMGLEFVSKLISVSFGGIIINGILLVIIIQGTRAAFALRKDAGFGEDDVEVFR
jgi:hypothetical protein